MALPARVPEFSPEGDGLLTTREYIEQCEKHPLAYKYTELLNGGIYDMPSEGLHHLRVVKHILMLLTAEFPDQESFCTGTPEHAKSKSMPAPDVYTFRKNPDFDRFYARAEDIQIYVEVCYSTHKRDLKVKPAIYMASGAELYTVVDIANNVLYHFRAGKRAKKTGFAEALKLTAP
jgi:Uma2 family endonuclease